MSHDPTANTSTSTADDAPTFTIQTLPAGSAPKDATFQPNVDGELAPGQPNNSADTTFDNATEGSKLDVHKGTAAVKQDDETEQQHQVEIKSATEKEPETAESI